MVLVYVNAFHYMNSSIHYTDVILVKKVKVTLEHAVKAQKGGGSIDIPRHCNGGWSTPRPGRFTPRYSNAGGPRGLSGRVRKISHPPGFKPRTT